MQPGQAHALQFHSAGVPSLPLTSCIPLPQPGNQIASQLPNKRRSGIPRLSPQASLVDPIRADTVGPRAWLCPVGSQGCSPVQSGSSWSSLVLRSLRILSSHGDCAGRGGCWDLEVLQRGQARSLCSDYSGRLCRVLCLSDTVGSLHGKGLPTRHSFEIRSSEMPWAGGMLWRKRIRILAVLLYLAA